MATARRRVLTGLLAGGAAATAGVVHMAEAGPAPQAAEREVVTALERIEAQ
jgi:hypothetical protein